MNFIKRTLDVVGFSIIMVIYAIILATIQSKLGLDVYINNAKLIHMPIILCGNIVSIIILGRLTLFILPFNKINSKYMISNAANCAIYAFKNIPKIIISILSAGYLFLWGIDLIFDKLYKKLLRYIPVDKHGLFATIFLVICMILIFAIFMIMGEKEDDK